MVSKNLSVCLSVTNFEPNYLRTGKTECAEIVLGHFWHNECSQKILFVQKAEGQNYNILIKYISTLTCDHAEISKIDLNLWKKTKLLKNFRQPVPWAERPKSTIRKTDMGNFIHKNHWKKVCNFGCQSGFGSLFFLKKQLIFDFLAGKNYPDSPHSQEGMKFATQISPLLNFCYNYRPNLDLQWSHFSSFCAGQYTWTSSTPLWFWCLSFCPKLLKMKEIIRLKCTALAMD